jgi:hypothetical protein
MALTRTTLSVAVGASQTSIRVASATGFAKGYSIRIGDEDLIQTADAVGTVIPVRRGVNGTNGKAHPASAGVVVGMQTDWSDPSQQTAVPYPIAGRARTIASYSAAGAIALPNAGSDAVAILNGTSVLAMTLADPGVDNDGDVLIILGNGKAAHTVTYTAGLGDAGSGYTVATFATGGQGCLSLIAASASWVPLSSPLAGTLTAIDISIA